ncbi:MAG: hypothetical protein E6G94_01095 [Alphaproteobacteria bacterium]|nr:MAG: hypothetical protein E6G94_01095 [Alphaproteobacteria bacterium]
MPRLLALPTFAALSIAGAALGAQIGRSTVHDINPFWFSPPDQGGFFSDLSAVKASDDTPVPAISTAEVPITSCVGCTNWNRPDRAQYATAWVEEPAPRAEARDEVVYDYVAPEEARDPAREQVVRYASYQVSADDAAPEEEEAAAEPQDDAPAGTD